MAININEARTKAARNNGLLPQNIISFAPLTFSQEYTTNQTGTLLITPRSIETIHVLGLYVVADIDVGEVDIDFITSGKKVLRMFTPRSQFIYIPTMNIWGNEGESLSLTSTTGNNELFVLVNYDIIENQQIRA